MSNGLRWPAVGGDLRRLEPMSERQAPAGARPSLLFMYTSILGAHAAQVVVPGARAVGELIGLVCEGHGRELLFEEVENRLPGASES